MSGDSGKTCLAAGLLLWLRDRALEVRAFKKGPDYIDAAWLAWASGERARNLDSYLMGFDGCRAAFVRGASRDGLNIVEGNRGLYDGADPDGTHSTAELAIALQAPVVLVVNASKVTRTAAAAILGCQTLDPRVRIGGVILNQVSGSRHEQVIRQAIAAICRVPVLGALPRARRDLLLPARHLGLLPPCEHRRLDEVRANLLDLVRQGLDLAGLQELAASAPALDIGRPEPAATADAHGLRIGVLQDSAFSFYYPENLEVLERSGASIVPLSPLTAPALPEDLDALYIGGGFPETHGAALSSNREFLAALSSAARDGLPVYAECGGLMLLGRAIRWQGARHPMAAVFPFEVEVLPSPQGHGYVDLLVDRPNPFYAPGLRIRGHEFHYSRIIPEGVPPPDACAVLRGTGCGNRRDGLLYENVWASYTHIHALGTPQWAPGLIDAARRRAAARRSPP